MEQLKSLKSTRFQHKSHQQGSDNFNDHFSDDDCYAESIWILTISIFYQILAFSSNSLRFKCMIASGLQLTKWITR